MNSSRIAQLKEMLKNDPEDSFLNYALALEHAKAAQTDVAIEIIEHIISKDPGYLGAYYQLGKFYEQTQQTQKAIETYNKGIIIAQQQKNKKAQGELNTALLMLEDE